MRCLLSWIERLQEIVLKQQNKLRMKMYLRGRLCQGKQGKLHLLMLGKLGAGVPPVCYPWRNRAGGNLLQSQR